jgi:hypothetical protein
MEHIAWMAWTGPTAIFFALLIATLGTMTWLAVAYPETERVGVLRMPTTRGDRLFISRFLVAVFQMRGGDFHPVVCLTDFVGHGGRDLSHGVTGEEAQIRINRTWKMSGNGGSKCRIWRRRAAYRGAPGC